MADAALATLADRAHCDFRCHGVGSSLGIDLQAALGTAVDGVDAVGGLASELVVRD